MVSTVFAQINNPITSSGSDDGVTFIGQFLPQMMTLLVVIAGIVFFFMLIIGAIKWISSGGDKGAIESARGQITNAIIGISILFMTWAIATLLERIFGIQLLQVDLAPVLAP